MILNYSAALTAFFASTAFFALGATAETLRVGVAGNPPFTIWKTIEPAGISVEVWEAVAQQGELEYEWVPLPNMVGVFDQVVAGELDVIIGPISITSKRLQQVTFTQPFYRADIGVLLPIAKPTLWSRIRPFVGVAFLSSIGLLMIGLFMIGNLLWLVEKDVKDSHFPPDYWHGVGNGMWFALVTLTTVGYGDRTPITPMGRFVAGVWMLITMLMVSSLIAGLTTTLTLAISGKSTERFLRPQNLRGAQMGVVAGTTGEQWAEFYEARLTKTADLKQAVDLLAIRKVEGVVFDVPALQYYLLQNPDAPFRVAEFALAQENYGFALPWDSPLKQELDVALLELQETGKIQRIAQDWLEP
ncbi:MAG: transporter substrate-binding domain-containing protein [Microcoleaceae cyanobacterium]